MANDDKKPDDLDGIQFPTEPFVMEPYASIGKLDDRVGSLEAKLEKLVAHFGALDASISRLARNDTSTAGSIAALRDVLILLQQRVSELEPRLQ